MSELLKGLSKATVIERVVAKCIRDSYWRKSAEVEALSFLTKAEKGRAKEVRDYVAKAYADAGLDDRGRQATPPRGVATLPMTINVVAIVRFLAGRMAAKEEDPRGYVLSYFAPEDRETVAPIVDAVLAEKLGGAL